MNLDSGLEDRVEQLKSNLKCNLVYTRDGIYSNYLLTMFKKEYEDQAVLRKVIREET